MKENKGITLVSLVVTIIVLIILAGVSINLTLGENGIITVAKKAKENIELAKVEEETRLNELYTQIEAEGGATGEISYDAIAKLNEFKMSIADYIEEAGGVKPEYTANSTTFGESIKGIVAEVTKNATATAEDIAEGKTAWVNGKLITGTVEKTSNSKILVSSQSKGSGLVTSGLHTHTFDFSGIPNFKELTSDNFAVGFSDTNANETSGHAINAVDYNTSTGVLTVKVATSSGPNDHYHGYTVFAKCYYIN